jgi:hypothetical protein
MSCLQKQNSKSHPPLTPTNYCCLTYSRTRVIYVTFASATASGGISSNQVRLQLFVLAYNLGNFLRQAVLPRAVRHWTLTTLREKLIKIGAKVVRHSRKIVFQMAEVAVPRELFRAILEGIGRLRLPAAASG